jgi:hypothetical protein
MFQAIGSMAIVLGLFGTWLAAKQRAGWLVCIVSSVMWLPALVTGSQWAAVANCGLSIAICVRNFGTQADDIDQSRWSVEAVAEHGHDRDLLETELHESRR